MSPEVLLILLILAIPTYFICKWGMKKIKIGNDENRKYLALVPTFILSPLIFVGVIMVWIISVSYYPAQEFVQTKWNSNIQERYKMSNDIIDSEMLLGKTRKEVIDLLGDDYFSSQENRLIYELGFVPGLLNIDPDYLEITLKDGKVINVEQYEG